MASKDQTIRLKEVYCPHCHLSTRADYPRCIHCRKPFRSSPQERIAPVTGGTKRQNYPAADERCSAGG
jgi:uncharacterized paraquat-inducible protein A